MESLNEIDVVNSSPSELLAFTLNITIKHDVNEDNNSSSTQEPMETIPVENFEHINAKSLLINFSWNLALALLS